MDKLDEIYCRQKQFDDELAKKRGLEGVSKEEWLQKETLAMISELAELLDEVNFKWWKNPKVLDDAAIKEELIDILHFFMCICIKAGMTPQEIRDIYVYKNEENFRRQQGKSQKDGYS